MTKYALLVGVSNYESGLKPFPEAIKNAEAIEEVLLDPELGNFEPNNIMFLANADRTRIEKAIKKLFFERQIDDLVLLFFSGHSIKDNAGKLYFGARNTRTNSQGNLIRSSAIAAKFLRKQMNNCKSKRQVILLDSCFSFLNDNERNIVNTGKELLSQGLAIWRRKTIAAIATASSSDRYCFASPEEELSPYTSYLVEGIKTGDADFNYDGLISITELHQYAKEKVQKINPKVEPEIYLARGNRPIEIIKIPLNNPEEKYYEKVLQNTIDGKISAEGRRSLDGLRKRLKLSSMKANEIEEKILQELQQELQQKLERFEQDFTEAIEQEISPTEEDIARLKENFQTILGLTDQQTCEIEAKVKSEIQTYSKHLQTYEQQLLGAMRKENPISQITREKLEQMQKRWKLSDRDVALAESRMTFELQSYQKKLLEYERELLQAIQKQDPMSHAKRSALIEKQKSLGILDEDIIEIKSRLSSKLEAYRQGLEEYKQILTQEIENNYPLTEQNRSQLKEIQKQLKLSNEDVIKIESQIIREKRLDVALVKPKLTTNQLITTTIPNNKIVSSNQLPNQLKTLNKPNLLADLANLPSKLNLANLPDLPNLPNPDLLFSNISLSRRKYLKWILFVITGGLLSFLAKLFLDLLGQTKPTNSTKPAINNQARTPDRSEKPAINNNIDSIKNREEKLSFTQESFQVITIDTRGQQISSTTKKAEYLTEDLGNGIELEMVYVPEGNFIMGTPPTERHSKNSERPQRQVSIKPFLMGKYQVTQAQWRQIANLAKIDRNLNPNPSDFQGDRNPVEMISWNHAVEFCQRLSQKTGHKYRLASEAEWEYAARAGTTTPFHFGATITSDLVNYNARFLYTTQPRGRFRNRTITVGSFPPNAFGLYDMHGNVWEWCQDTWHSNHSGAPIDGSPWISNNNTQSRVIRGGSWSSDAISCRSGFREPHPTNHRYRTLGFRIVREI